MSIVALTNSSSPVTVERATADSDPYSRETQLNGLALNFDAHDHTSAKGLGVGRVQTSAAPAASGQVRANGDAWQWWGAAAGAVRTAVDLEGAQTISGAKVFSANVGVGVTPEAMLAGYPTLRIGRDGAVYAGSSNAQVILAQNGIFNAAGSAVALFAGAASRVQLNAGSFNVDTAPSVAAGATQTWTTRAQIAPTGTLSLSPDASTAPLSMTWSPGSSLFQVSPGAVSANNTRLYCYNNLELNPSTGAVIPTSDNAYFLGNTTNRWGQVWAVNGTIQTSSAEMKQDITPLDPAACYQAAKDVRWYEYAYLPPAYTAPEPPPDIAYDASDDNETKAEKKAARDEAEAQAREAHAKMVVETASARNQRGFVFPAGAESKDEAGGTLPPVPDLFGLSDRESTTPQADLATLGCALQEVIRRLELLEAQP